MEHIPVIVIWLFNVYVWFRLIRSYFIFRKRRKRYETLLSFEAQQKHLYYDCVLIARDKKSQKRALIFFIVVVLPCCLWGIFG